MTGDEDIDLIDWVVKSQDCEPIMVESLQIVVVRRRTGLVLDKGKEIN